MSEIPYSRRKFSSPSKSMLSLNNVSLDKSGLMEVQGDSSTASIDFTQQRIRLRKMQEQIKRNLDERREQVKKEK